MIQPGQAPPQGAPQDPEMVKPPMPPKMDAPKMSNSFQDTDPNKLSTDGDKKFEGKLSNSFGSEFNSSPLVKKSKPTKKENASKIKSLSGFRSLS